jgi:hypothetical protein
MSKPRASMAGVTITSAVRSGTKVTVKGTATAAPVTVHLLMAGAIVDTQVVNINSNGDWEAVFNPAPTADRARALAPGGGSDEEDIVAGAPET